MCKESILKVFILPAILNFLNFAVLLKIRKCLENHQRKSYFEHTFYLVVIVLI